MRIAWFSPWPPQRSGIAGRSAELVAELARRGHAIDVFVDERLVPAAARAGAEPPEPGMIRVQSAHDFVWRAIGGQFDLNIYQIGNSRLHEFIWPYAFRWPGLAVLHDARLHHARGRALLARDRTADYRAEFAWSQPGVNPDAAELAVAGFDGAYYYLWPMVRSIVEASRLVAVHSKGAALELSRDWPSQPIEHITLGEGSARVPTGVDRAAARAALGFAGDAVVFGVFGALTAGKRLPEILRAFRATLARVPEARLVLAGAPDASDCLDTIGPLGIAHAVSRLGVLDDEAFDRAIAAVDVSLNLRWPTARETSGPWLRALSAGRATIVTDLLHQTDVPAIDPRSWTTAGPAGAEPVAVAIDILDEDHSLRLAMRRLAADAPFRQQLGDAGRRYWEITHTLERMADDYERVMPLAAAHEAPVAALPAGLLPNPRAALGDLLAPFGDMSCELF